MSATEAASNAPRRTPSERMEPWTHDDFCLDLEYGWHDNDGTFHPPCGGAAHLRYHQRVFNIGNQSLVTPPASAPESAS